MVAHSRAAGHAGENGVADDTTKWIRCSRRAGLHALRMRRTHYRHLSRNVFASPLDKVLWTDRNHLDVRQVQEYFAQYLYLPRLTYKELLIDAIRDGVASLTWQSDTFAYTGGYDEKQKRYVGLQAGRSGVYKLRLDQGEANQTSLARELRISFDAV